MKKSDNDTKLVAVAKFASSPRANIAAGMLRSAGIPCILDNEVASTLFGIQLLPDAGISLKVYDRDAEAATALLRDHGDLE